MEGQYVAYTFFRVDPAWRRLPIEERAAAKDAFVEVVEDFPSRYDVASLRQHRWVRGDWQLLPWIFGRGRTPDGDRLRARIPAIGRFKMLDNLRRTLSAPAAFLTLVWTAIRIWETRTVQRLVGREGEPAE